jgi:hypothetical protein
MQDPVLNDCKGILSSISVVFIPALCVASSSLSKDSFLSVGSRNKNPSNLSKSQSMFSSFTIDSIRFIAAVWLLAATRTPSNRVSAQDYSIYHLMHV